ncbi:HAD-IA family hydrolase [Aliarcobacter butzleri]|uniref:HAD-IA family hydrolase n=1 Tax=Aliarcobacter butzleri TaxID=28197 RepID=UPI0021B250A4|nr:HAD-IA family hydrolase [Aliarcobacter butzleri]MCT7584810.1 HAD-IA family hydrolase [Aliarcobacter butzleri]
MKSLFDIEFKRCLVNKDIKFISFDIFDTLVFRKVNEPIDIFEIIGNHKDIKNIFGEENSFKELRITAEKVAREKSLENEITLNQIYDEFEYLTKKQQEKLIKIELKIEKENLFINHKIEKWINQALEHNKKVIFISDMYLNKEQIKDVILNKLANIEKIEEIFVSSDLKKTKYDGSIYDYILDKYSIKPSQILHIGDNLLSDISQANTKGISTIFYRPNYFYLEQLKYENSYYHFSQETLSLRALATLNNPYEDEVYKFYYNFGATICGPIFWAFSYWLMNICLKNREFSIGFILREGDIFKKYFEEILKYNKKEDKFKLKNIYISRKSLFLPALMEEDYSLDFKNSKYFRNFTLKDFYNKFNLTISNKELKKYENEELKNLENIKNIIQQDLSDNLEEIFKNRDIQKNLFLKYWKSLKIDKNSLIFDFGANASMNKILNLLFKNNSYISTLFYRTKLGIKNSINKKQYTFIPYNKQNSFKIDLLRRSPDIFEILFNGLLGTTLAYEKKLSKVERIIDKNSTIKDENIIKAFKEGIDEYFKTSIEYKQANSKFSSNDILNLMTRVIEFPTSYEAKYLGELSINTSDDASCLVPIVSEKSIEKLEQNGIEKTLKNLKDDLYKDWADIPWVQGSITKLKQNYLTNIYFSNDINRKYLALLLEQIDKFTIKEVCVYGAGEFFLQLLPELIVRNIEVKYLIETKPKQDKFFGYKVLSVEDIAKTEEKNFIIASAAFASAMKEKLEDEFDLFGKKMRHLFFIE